MVTTRLMPDNRVLVTFMTAQPEAAVVEVHGDFDGWRQPHPMRRTHDGTWRTAVGLKPGRRYTFRYRVDGVRWVRDAEAERYAGKALEAETSVVAT